MYLTENNGECQTVSFITTEEILLLPILLISVSEPEERDPEVFRYKFEECGKSWISLSVQNTYTYILDTALGKPCKWNEHLCTYMWIQQKHTKSPFEGCNAIPFERRG